MTIQEHLDICRYMGSLTAQQLEYAFPWFKSKERNSADTLKPLPSIEDTLKTFEELVLNKDNK